MTCLHINESDQPTDQSLLYIRLKTGFIRVREMSGKFSFFKVRELSGNSVMCQGKLYFAKMSGKCQGILHFSQMKLGCLVPMYLFS